MIVGVFGLLVIARDVQTLRLWEVIYTDLPAVMLGALIGLIEIGRLPRRVGLVRALGWVVNRIADW